MSIEPIIVNGGRLLGGGCYSHSVEITKKYAPHPHTSMAKTFVKATFFLLKKHLKKIVFMKSHEMFSR